MSTTGLRELRPDDLEAALEELLVPRLVTLVRRRRPGHCMRVSDVDASLAVRLCRLVRSSVPEAQVYVLGAGQNGAHDVSISSTKLVELRNPDSAGTPRPPLLVFVPAHTRASAEDSFGMATFEEIGLGDVYGTLAEALTTELPADLRAAIADLFGVLAERGWAYADQLARARYLLTLELNDFDRTAAGAAVFELGLVPDFDLFSDLSQVLRRATRNLNQAQTLATPTRPERGRVIELGLTDVAYVARLAEFVAQVGLEDPRSWTRRIVVDRTNWGLAFQHWPLPDDVVHDRVRIEVGELPLRRAGERPEDLRDEALRMVAGQQYLPAGAQGANQLAVTFGVTPDPRQIAGLTRFTVALISEDGGPTGVLTSVRVSTRNKSEYKATLKKLRKAHLEDGWHFVRVLGVDSDGTPFPLEGAEDSGQPPHESQRFYVIADGGTDEPAELQARKEDGVTQALLRLRFDALADGRQWQDVTCTSVAWKQGPGAGSTLHAVFAGEATAEIRLGSGLVGIEKTILADPGTPGSWRLAGGATLIREPGSWPDIRGAEVSQFVAARAELFRLIRGNDDLVIEACDLLELQEPVLRYAQSYADLLGSELRRMEETGEGGPDLAALLSLDAVIAELPAEPAPMQEVAIVSPTHPLRLLWLVTWAQLGYGWLQSDRPANSKVLRSAKAALLDEIAPLGFPLAVPRSDGRLLMAVGDLSPYWGAFVPTDTPDPQGLVQSLAAAVGTGTPGSVSARVTGRLLADRVERYLRTHPYITTLTVAAVNPGRAEVLADMLVTLQRRAGFTDIRYDMRLFHREQNAPDAGQALVDLLHGEWNTAHEVEHFRAPTESLVPKLSVSLRPLDEFRSAAGEHAVHITLLFDAFGGEQFDVGPAAGGDRVPLHGLVQEVSTSYQAAGEIISWRKVPRHGRTHTLPAAPELSELLGGLPALMSAATAAVSAGQVSAHLVPHVTLTLDPADRTLLHQAHRSSDWVITVDRTMGMEFFDSPSAAQRSEYVIDHTPAETGGLGHQVVVSSRSVDELRALLVPAMTQHDVGIDPRHVGTFFNQLRQLSGRLAFKIASAAPAQRTEVLGLALARLYLAYQGVLREQLLVPLDSHLELYRDARRQAGELADLVRLDRTDLALFDLDASRRLITCSLVEVKCTTSLPDLSSYQQLKERISQQINRSAEVLCEHYDPQYSQPDRPDRVVKNAEFARLLRFYLERGRRHEIVPAPVAEEANWLLDRLDEGYRLEFTRTGLIFDLSGRETAVEHEGGIEFHRVGRHLIDELIDHIPTDPALAAQDVERANSDSPGMHSPSELTTPRLTDAAFQRPMRDRTVPVAEPTPPHDTGEQWGDEGQPTGERHGEPADAPDRSVGAQPRTVQPIRNRNATTEPDIVTGTSRSSPQYGILGEISGQKIALDLNETHTISLFGVQGGGKSYTLGSIIEMASISVRPVNSLPRPLATIVFHYSKTQDYSPEFTSMTAANDDAEQIKVLRERYGVEPRGLDDVVMLAPEDQVTARKLEHPSISVFPLKFGSPELSVQHWKFLMGATGNQASYIRQIHRIMRANRADLTLERIRHEVDQSPLPDNLKQLAQHRLDFASDYIDDRTRISELVKPGRVIIVDLRDELISKDEALGLFVVLMEIFAEAQLPGNRFNKLVVFDEAHKYIDSQELVSGLIDSVREMRHKGMSVLVASQDPPSVPVSLIELSDHIILHKFTSPAWLKHVQKANAALSELTATRMANLAPGEAYVWASKATDPAVTRGAVKISCRPRVTQHGGGTKTAIGT